MGQKLKVLIYNIAANYPGYGDYLRIDKIRDVLVQGDWDVIGLNEVYNKTLRDILLESRDIQAAYPYRLYNLFEYTDLPLFKFDNGLVILSKHTITRYERIEYKNKLTTTINRIFPPKDALFAQIEFDKELIDFFFTHLQWGNSSIQVEYRIKQFRELSEIVQKYSNSGLPKIICGDMNTYGYPDKTEEYQTFISYFPNFTDYHALFHPDDPALTWSPENKRVFKWLSGEKFDYILGSKHFKGIASNIIKFKSRIGPFRMKWKPTDKIRFTDRYKIQLKRLARVALWPLVILFNLILTIYRLIHGYPQVLFLTHKDLSDHYALETIIEIID